MLRASELLALHLAHPVCYRSLCAHQHLVRTLGGPQATQVNHWALMLALDLLVLLRAHILTPYITEVSFSIYYPCSLLSVNLLN